MALIALIPLIAPMALITLIAPIALIALIAPIALITPIALIAPMALIDSASSLSSHGAHTLTDASFTQKEFLLRLEEPTEQVVGLVNQSDS